MDQVGQQSDTPGRDEHGRLRERGESKYAKRERDRTNPLPRALNPLVNKAVGMGVALGVDAAVLVVIAFQRNRRRAARHRHVPMGTFIPMTVPATAVVMVRLAKGVRHSRRLGQATSNALLLAEEPNPVVRVTP